MKFICGKLPRWQQSMAAKYSYQTFYRNVLAPDCHTEFGRCSLELKQFWRVPSTSLLLLLWISRHVKRSGINRIWRSQLIGHPGHDDCQRQWRWHCCQIRVSCAILVKQQTATPLCAPLLMLKRIAYVNVLLFITQFVYTECICLRILFEASRMQQINTRSLCRRLCIQVLLAPSINIGQKQLVNAVGGKIKSNLKHYSNCYWHYGYSGNLSGGIMTMTMTHDMLPHIQKVHDSCKVKKRKKILNLEKLVTCPTLGIPVT